MYGQIGGPGSGGWNLPEWWDFTGSWAMGGHREDEGHFRQRAEPEGFLEKGRRRL